MSPHHKGRPAREVVCLGSAWWGPVVVGRARAEFPGYGAHARQCRRREHAQVQWAGCHGGALI
jgi:hypothetical protein